MTIFDKIEQDINLLDCIQAIEPSTKIEKQGDTTRLNPCPICKHNNCCTVYDNGNYLTYSCFSQAHPSNEQGKNGGSVIKFVKEKFNLDDTEIIDKFVELGLIDNNVLSEFEQKQMRGTEHNNRTSPTNTHQTFYKNNDNINTVNNQELDPINSDDKLLEILDSKSNTGAETESVKLEQMFDFTEHLRDRQNNYLSDKKLMSATMEYFKSRGFTDLERNKINILKYSIYGYLDYNNVFRIGIPLENKGFVYGIEGKSSDKKNTTSQDTYVNNKVQKSNKIPFNLECIEIAKRENKPVILTESFFDSLCFIEQDRYSVGYMGKLKKDNLEYLIEQIKDLKIITAFDNDQAGHNYYTELTERLENRLGFKRELVKFKLDEGQDPNDLYRNTKMYFIQELKRCETEAEAEHKEYKTKKQYGNSILGTYFTDMQKEADPLIERWKNVKFGFKGLDNVLENVNPCLYVLGGISGMGKTTFTQQLMVNIARQGQKVLMFNLEQSKEQVIGKIVALEHNTPLIKEIERNRETHKALLSGTDIIRQTDKYKSVRDSQRLSDTNKRLIEYGNNIEYADLNNCRTIEEIEKYIKNNYIPRVKDRPVIMIDYLQYLTTDKKHMTKKDSMDYVVKTLKNISMRLGIPIFLISSLNRESYSEPIQTTSFKESGDIEYSADIIIGLHLDAITKARKGIDSETKNENEIDFSRRKKEIAKQEIERYPRVINVSILKNRWGRAYSEGFVFNYYTDGDIYTETNTFERLRPPVNILSDVEKQLRCYVFNDDINKKDLSKMFKCEILDPVIKKLEQESDFPQEFKETKTEQKTEQKATQTTMDDIKIVENTDTFDVPF